MRGKVQLAVIVAAIVSVLFLFRQPAPEVAGSGTLSVKVLTYNVNDDGWTALRGRRLAALVDAQMPDIVTLQEVGIEIAEGAIEAISVRSDLETNLADDYEFYFPESLDPILVRRASGFRLVESGSSELYDCRFSRAANWLRLEDGESGKELIVYNTHLCPWVMPFPDGELSAEERNQMEAQEIVALMRTHASPGVVQIVAGDFNAVPESNTIQYLLHGAALPVTGQVSPLPLRDTWASAPENSGAKPVTTDPDLDALMPRGDITYREAGIVPFTLDWILATEAAEITEAEVLDGPETQGVSDHLPVTATIRL